MHVHLRQKKGRKVSSTRWLTRQLNDPYVARAKAEGYRSRSAFKLIEIDDKFRFLKPGAVVLDLGAAPGGWSQVACQRVGARGQVVGVDLVDMNPIAGVTLLKHDMMAEGVSEKILAVLGGLADVVLSDMAAPTTGHRATDHLRTLILFEAALETAEEVLKPGGVAANRKIGRSAPGGVFIGKVFQGGATGELLNRVKRSFASVKHVKPPASRSASVELYLVATGFRGKVSES